VNHSKSYSSIFGEKWGDVGTLEGQVVKIADIVAYINHDTNDAIRAGVIVEEDLPPQVTGILGNSSSQRINSLVMDIVKQTIKVLNKGNKKPQILMSRTVQDAANKLRDFLFARVYRSAKANGLQKKAGSVICFLYDFFYNRTDHLPKEYFIRNEDIDRIVTDYIAGMTDQFALNKVKEIKTGKKITAASYL
jgi:dGTPase